MVLCWFVKNKTVHDKWVPLVCVVAPAICFVISKNSALLFGSYVFDIELIILNGALTFLGLMVISKKATGVTKF